MNLKLKAIEGNVGWNPDMLDELIYEREVNKKGQDLAIEIYTEYWKKHQELQEKIANDPHYHYDLKWMS